MSSVSYTRFGGEVRRYTGFRQALHLGGSCIYAVARRPGTRRRSGRWPGWAATRACSMTGDAARIWRRPLHRQQYRGRQYRVAHARLEATIFGTHGILEFAPFFEAGHVWHQMSQIPSSSLASGRRHGLSRNRGAVRGRLRGYRMGRRGRRGFFGHQLSVLIRSTGESLTVLSKPESTSAGLQTSQDSIWALLFLNSSSPLMLR